MARLCVVLVLLAACGSPSRPTSTAASPPEAEPDGGALTQIVFDGPIRALSARPEGGFRAGVGTEVIVFDSAGTIGSRSPLPAPLDALSAEQVNEMTLSNGTLNPGFGAPVSAPDGVTSMAASYDRAFGVTAAGIQDLRSGDVVLDALPPGTSVLVANGGTLVLGHSAGLSALSLASGELSELAAIGPVMGLALDHEGYYIAAVQGAGWVRVTADAETSVLDANGPVGALAFDAVHRHLAVAVRDEVTVYDYLPLIGQDAATWAMRDDRPMRPFEAGRYSLSGAEYWPYRSDQEPDYPADVLWGFYPEAGVVFEGEAPTRTATPAAVGCAEQSFAALQAFLATPPAELETALGETTSARFYLWINDYSEAVDPFPEPRRPARLWYWRRNPAVSGRVPGFWKWETTITQNGTCEIPDPSQTDWSAI